ncbi:MAG: tetratricopeptide repeat protein [Parvibaculaceae bacterium]|nr:tetratricopeptide repeat protein [Parvibaculaceae bacterium]
MSSLSICRTLLVAGSATVLLSSVARAELPAPATVPSAPVLSGMPSISPGTPPAQAGAPAPAAADTPPANGSDAIATLLKQADFWNSRGQPDKAIDALRRVLAVDSHNLSAIYGMAIATANQGDIVSAKNYFNQFVALSPNDPRIPDLREAMVRKPVPSAAIQQARDLFAKGKFRDGIAAYRRAFNNQPPPDAYAVEFYVSLAGMPGGWKEAQAGLGKLYERRPTDASLGIAYAKVLTYRGETRRDGIRLLQKYASNYADADEAWRTALIWLIPQNGFASTPRPPFQLSAENQALYDAYYAQHPKDTQVRAMLDDYVKIQRDGQRQIIETVQKNVARQMRGYTALKAGNTAEAISFFREQINKNPNDAAALGGMGMAYMRQKNYETAENYFNRAIRADPSKRKDWASALNTIHFFNNMKQAQAAIDANQNARAETLLRPLANGSYGGERSNIALASSALGSVLAEENRPVEAERYFRKALSLDPRNQNALAGLAGVLMRQNKVSEAQSLMSRLTAAQRDQLAPGLVSAQAQADLARAKNLADSGDVNGANAAYSSALAKAPSDPWLRVEYANFLAARGNSEDAGRLVDPVTDPAVATPSSLFAAAIYYSTQGDTARANELMNRIPAKSRTAAMSRFASDLALNRSMAGAQQTCGTAGTVSPSSVASLRNVLASRSTLANGDRSYIAQLLYNCGEKAQAISMARTAAATSPKTSPADYGGYIYVLLQSGYQADADRLISQLNANVRTPADRKAMAELNAGVASRRADALRDAGDIGGAYNTIAAAYPASQNSPQLLAALARVYQSNKQTGDAQRIYDYLLARTPDDPNVLQGAALNQMSAGNYGQAQGYLSQAIERTPNDPRLYLLRGQMYRADGNLNSALKAFEKARELRTAQLTPQVTAPAVKAALPGFPATETAKPIQKQLPALPGNFFPAQAPQQELQQPREPLIPPTRVAPTVTLPPVSTPATASVPASSQPASLPAVIPASQGMPASTPSVPVNIPSVPVMPAPPPASNWPGQGLPMQLSPFAS